MVRLYTTILLVVSLFSSPVTARLNPVQPLQFHGQTYCTSWSINEAQGYWATVAHCAAAARMLEEQSQGDQSTIDGRQAVVIFQGTEVDTAVFQADAHAEAFELAKKAQEVGDPVAIVGYPYGFARARTSGSVAIRSLWLWHPVLEHYVMNDILDITTAPGNSGSPVLNPKGKVVGLLWGGFGDVPLSITVPLDALRTSIGRFFRPR